MPYYHTAIPTRSARSDKESLVGFLTIAAMGESLAATAALKAVEALPGDARRTECAMAAAHAAIKAVDEDWQEGGGMAALTILVGERGRLAYRSVGRFRALHTGTITEVVIQAEDLEDAERSWRQRFPARPAELVESDADALAGRGLGILL